MKGCGGWYTANCDAGTGTDPVTQNITSQYTTCPRKILASVEYCRRRKHFGWQNLDYFCSRWTSLVEFSYGPAVQSRHHLQTVQTTAEGTPFRLVWTRRSVTSDILRLRKTLTYLLQYPQKSLPQTKINLDYLGRSPTVPIETKISMAGKLAYAKFQDDILRGTILHVLQSNA